MEVHPQDVAAMLGEGDGIRLIDVRTREEWDIARIEGAELLTEELFEQLQGSPKDTAIVFYCHTGVRSLHAASWFAERGFSGVRSMAGGIHAWSQLVDPDVPTY